MKFDIVEFYPSITENLLDNSVSYVQTLTMIPDDIVPLIKQAHPFSLLRETFGWKKVKMSYLMLQWDYMMVQSFFIYPLGKL